MGYESFQLPTDGTTLARIIRAHHINEVTQHSPRFMMWELARWYMMGYRRFSTLDPNGRIVQSHLMDNDGNMEYVDQSLAVAINQNAGRISSLDLRPAIARQDTNLEALRQRSVAQIIADKLVGVGDKRAKAMFAYYFTCLGCCGLQADTLDHPTLGIVGDLEVVHPREIFAFPRLHGDLTKERGLLRRHTVPLYWLKDKFGPSVTRRRNDMDIYRVRTEDFYSENYRATTPQPGFNESSGQPADQDGMMDVVHINQVWLHGPQDTCARYIITSGDATIEDRDFTGRDVYCPFAFDRYMNNHDFYGLGLFDVLFATSRAAEKMVKWLVANVVKSERYGMLLLPQGTINERKALKNNGDEMKTLFYEPDAALPSVPNPLQIQPNNSGDFPGKVAAYLDAVKSKLNPQRDLISEKGRVDSTTGLQFLDEQINKAVTTPSQGVERVWSRVYKGMLQAGTAKMMLSDRPIQVPRLTLDLAGAVIDAKTQTVSFRDNPLPDISALEVTVREIAPKSTLAQKQAAFSMLNIKDFTGAGVTDVTSLKIYLFEQGLDVEAWMEDDRNAYRAIVHDALILFGDGETPGMITPSPYSASPNLQLRVLVAFMKSPQFRMASTDVQNSFADYVDVLRSWMGNVLPVGIPNPDDAMALGQPTMNGSPPQPPQGM